MNEIVLATSKQEGLIDDIAQLMEDVLRNTSAIAYKVGIFMSTENSKKVVPLLKEKTGLSDATLSKMNKAYGLYNTVCAYYNPNGFDESVLEIPYVSMYDMRKYIEDYESELYASCLTLTDFILFMKNNVKNHKLICKIEEEEVEDTDVIKGDSSEKDKLSTRTIIILEDNVGYIKECLEEALITNEFDREIFNDILKQLR